MKSSKEGYRTINEVELFEGNLPTAMPQRYVRVLLLEHDIAQYGIANSQSVIHLYHNVGQNAAGRNHLTVHTILHVTLNS